MQPLSGSGDLRLQDVRIPVVLGLKIIRSRVIALRIFAGGVPAFVTGVSVNDFDITKDDLKSAIWSGRVGAGLDFTLLTFDIGYDFGLSDLFAETSGDDGVKRNAFFVAAGLRFGI